MPKVKFTVRSLEIPETGFNLEDLTIETESTIEEYMEALRVFREIIPTFIEELNRAMSGGN